MKVICYTSNSRRDALICQALASGFERHGESVEVLHTAELQPADLAVFVGTRWSNFKVYKAARAAGQHTLMLDKGYFTRARYHRMSIDTPQPTYIAKVQHDPARLNAQHYVANTVERTTPTSIVYVEATQKYYDFHELGDMLVYTAGVCEQLKQVAGANGMRVVYRPRMKAHGGPPLAPAGTVMLPNLPMRELLPTAHCVVVHGSTAGVEALLAGVPVVSLGDQGSNPVHDLCIAGVNDAMLHPPLPLRAAVLKRCAQLAWCQFNRAEIASGFAWEHTKPWLNQ